MSLDHKALRIAELEGQVAACRDRVALLEALVEAQEAEIQRLREEYRQLRADWDFEFPPPGQEDPR